MSFAFNQPVFQTFLKFEKLSQASSVLGDEYYSMESYLKDLENLYANGLVDGLDASDDAMKRLEEEIKRIRGEIDKTEKTTRKWVESLQDLLDSAIRSGLKTTSALFDEIFQKEENIKKLEEELSELAKDEADNKKAIEEAQSELDDATARGNASAIKSPEEKLRKAKDTLTTTQSTIKAVKDEKKSVEDGSSAWKAWGNSAMQALASVLEALAGELAAKAVGSLFDAPWLSAALVAGSVAAYAAASWARSQTFAQGGIVGGTSYSGDNVIARVNSGELILNMAQQDNVANALSALADMSGIGGAGGAGVNVYLSGASFYGLDEPAVGKAIYDNIRQLQYEGVI